MSFFAMINTGGTLSLPVSADTPVVPKSDTPMKTPDRPDALEVANLEFRSAMEGRGGSFSQARSYYQTFLGNPGGATVSQRAEAMFFLARCFQEDRHTAGARHAYQQLLRNADYAATDYGLQAEFCLGQISNRAGGHDIAIEELQTFLTHYEARRPPPRELAPLVDWARALMADSHSRNGNPTEALRLYQVVLGSRPPVAAETAAFARRGIAYIAESSAAGAASATTNDERTRLWTQSLAALQILQRDHASDPITARTLRNVAGSAYDQANGTTDSVRWQRAKTLFTQVHALGESSPHRNDALYFLGWCEFRLGNFSSGSTHFTAFAASATSDPRRSGAIALAAICRAEHSFRTGQTADAGDKVTHYRAAITALSGITDNTFQTYVRGLTSRVARELFPRLGPTAPDNAFTTNHTAVRTILGNEAYSSLLYNCGQRLLYPTAGTPSAADKAQAIALFRRAATDHETTRGGRLAAIEVARADGNWANMATAALALRDSLPAPSATMSAADRNLWIFATTQRAFAQVLNGRGADATATLTAAETTMRDAFNATTFDTCRGQLLGGTWGAILAHGQSLVSRDVTTPCALTANEQTQAAACFTYLIESDATQGQVVRAEAHLGRAKYYHHIGRLDDARNTYNGISLRFTGAAFEGVRTRAAQAVEALPR